MRKSKRPISKAKMYGFNPWVDQLDAINQIVADTGEKESTILRKLVDEALVERRRKIADAELGESPSAQGFAEALQTMQNLVAQTGSSGRYLTAHAGCQLGFAARDTR